MDTLWTERTALLLGGEAVDRLAAATVAVFGLGGVGSWAAEALVRCGVGRLVLVDADRVAPSNINRQLAALRSTVGRFKTDVLRERFLDINPAAVIETRPVFYGPETADEFDMADWDHVADAVDTVTAKLLLAERAAAAGVPLISSMGTGGKTDPSRLRAGDVYDTAVCPLARVMRHELRKRGIASLRVVWSDEPSARAVGQSAGEAPEGPAADAMEAAPAGKRPVGSAPFVPPAAGLLMASEIVRRLSGPILQEPKGSNEVE